MRRLTLSAIPVTRTAVAAAAVVAPNRLSLSLRLQSAFGRSGGSFGRPSSSSTAPSTGVHGNPRARLVGANAAGPVPPAPRPNSTNDDELSPATRAAMRDDAIVLSAVFRHIPSGGAISVKSLAAQLPPDVQEALSEKHNGLGAFLEQRKQFFLLKPRPEDGVLFVAANPIAAQRFAVREVQQATMRQMLGLPGEGEEDRGRGQRGRGRVSGGSGGGGGRGFGRERGGAGGNSGYAQRNGDRRTLNSSSGSGGGGGNGERDRRGYQGTPRGQGRSGSFSGDSRGSGGGRGGFRGGRPRDGPMGGREQNFGGRSGH